MSRYKEFQGKTLDDAIAEACEYYGVPREKLEIEILNDAKTGIFGLVGVKKAEIRAARMTLPDAVSDILEEDQQERRPSALQQRSASSGQKPDASLPRGQRSGGRRQSERSGSPVSAQLTEPGPGTACGSTAGAASGAGTGRLAGAVSSSGADDTLSVGVSGVESGCAVPKGRKESGPRTSVDPGYADAVEFDLSKMDATELTSIVESVIVRLVEPIVGKFDCRVEIAEQRIRVSIDCGDDAGLLVGRDGQTMAALQYLAGRIISRKIGGLARLHIDADHYRERRDDKLKELALSLAERVKTGGRSVSTRPLNAYQRRIVHLTLEQNPDVVTRSKGDGLQRRVIIYPKRDGENTDQPVPCPDSGIDDPVTGADDIVDGPDPWNR
ncbi:MAG: Jag N-terminal domain-containing protein [Desulfovibrio sp.]|jgi:spoIIIJ-associated protein|nr:Jag N-terminal domain-containing protein [Desulfovibrio sp.]